jgi:hypothetical protein
MTDPLEIYQHQIGILEVELRNLQKRSKLFGWIRLIAMLAFLTCIALAWTNSSLLYLPFAALFITVFFVILTKHLDVDDKIENQKRLIEINETEIEILNHRFTELPDGSEYNPADHEYANDLDIFGRASLFQYINRCTSEQAKQLFARWLLHPSPVEQIINRQKAIKELGPQFQWRQQLQSFGVAHPVNIRIENKIQEWLKEPFRFIDKVYWRILRFAMPLISFTLLGLHIAGIINGSLFYPLITLMLLLSFGVSKLVMPVYTHLDKATSQLETLSDSIEWIEKKKFTSNLLIALQRSYLSDSTFSSQTIKRLKQILDRFDIRLNPLVFIPLNTFLFWDLQQVLILENWKKINKDHIGDWFQSLAEFESISSLANLSFNHPHWTSPILTEKPGTVIADSLGHPLIPKEQLVYNSFDTEGTGLLNLITGSNMAGKSTFLRSVGVNIVLAMMGSDVCAKTFAVSHMKVFSSMRVSDNLEENTSTFYAELKKLKDIIQAVYNNEKVFLLLDEILRGTNSADRHTGSKALIKQLIQHNAAGLIATHDLELTKLADDYPGRIENYHFDVQVANEELYFDYKLKRGICQSMNASLLMKKIGIEI